MIAFPKMLWAQTETQQSGCVTQHQGVQGPDQWEGLCSCSENPQAPESGDDLVGDPAVQSLSLAQEPVGGERIRISPGSTFLGSGLWDLRVQELEDSKWITV